jgi:NAD(P)-dependent dehydrogenase (short-subunit alcohol dehydrogenase family)
MSVKSYAGSKVFITGGTSGIGRAMALSLAQQGANVVVAGRRGARGDEVANEMRAQAKDAATQHLSYAPLDVGDAEQASRVVAAAAESLGGLDVVITCAGVVYPGTFAEGSAAELEEEMRTNFYGTVHVVRAALPLLRSTEHTGLGAHICSVNSLAGVFGVFGYSGYCASKFAVVGFMEVLRQELLSDKIKITVVLPGDTATPMLEAENKRKPAETSAITGNAKVVSPEHVAKLALDGVAAGDFHVTIDFDGALAYTMATRFPGIMRKFADYSLGKLQRRRATS